MFVFHMIALRIVHIIASVCWAEEHMHKECT